MKTSKCEFVRTGSWFCSSFMAAVFLSSFIVPLVVSAGEKELPMRKAVQRGTNWCWAATAQIMINYYEESVSHLSRETAQNMPDHFDYMEQCTILNETFAGKDGNYGCCDSPNWYPDGFPCDRRLEAEDHDDVMRRYGVVTQREGPLNAKDIKDQIDDDYPFTMDIDVFGSGHSVIGVGYLNDGAQVIYWDPQEHEYSFPELSDLSWHSTTITEGSAFLNSWDALDDPDDPNDPDDPVDPFGCSETQCDNEHGGSEHAQGCCDGECVSLYEREHCGDACTRCRDNQICKKVFAPPEPGDIYNEYQGKCETCKDNEIVCGNECVRVGTTSNCLGCGDDCDPGDKCDAGGVGCWSDPESDPYKCGPHGIDCISPVPDVDDQRLGIACCDGECVNILMDNEHCNGCNEEVCEYHEACQPVNGVFGYYAYCDEQSKKSCGPGQTAVECGAYEECCWGKCKDLRTDEENCGGCGIECDDYRRMDDESCRFDKKMNKYRCFRDNDHDGLEDHEDNCPDDPNPDQLDCNGDGLGDACDPKICLRFGSNETYGLQPWNDDTPPVLKIPFRTSGEWWHDIELRWCDCTEYGPDKERCYEENCGSDPTEQDRELHFRHDGWHLVTWTKEWAGKNKKSSKRFSSLPPVVPPVIPPCWKGIRPDPEKVDCDIREYSWSRMELDFVTGVQAYHCAPYENVVFERGCHEDPEHNECISAYYWNWGEEPWWQFYNDPEKYKPGSGFIYPWDRGDWIGFEGRLWLRPEVTSDTPINELNSYAKFNVHPDPMADINPTDTEVWKPYPPIDEVIFPVVGPVLGPIVRPVTRPVGWP